MSFSNVGRPAGVWEECPNLITQSVCYDTLFTVSGFGSDSDFVSVQHLLFLKALGKP